MKTIWCVCAALSCCLWGGMGVQARTEADETAAVVMAETDEVQPEVLADTVKRSKAKPLKGSINFDPLSLQLQKRYVAKGDTFSHRFLDHLSVGFVTGASQIVPKGTRELKTAMPMGAMLSYDFNRLHALRLSALHTNYDLKVDDASIQHWEVDVDYMFNLSNYLYGYKRRKVVHVSPTLGLGYIRSSWHGAAKNGIKGQFGMNVGVGLGRNARIFAEPYVAVMSDGTDYSERSNLSRYDLVYGVKAGLAVNLDNTNEYYGSEVVYTRGFFYELSQGLSFFHGGDLGMFKTTGTGYRVSVGRWFDPIVGLRLSASGTDFYWTHALVSNDKIQQPYEQHYKSAMFSGRLEGLINPLNFIPVWREVRHHFEMNVALGGEFGWLTRNVSDTGDGSKVIGSNIYGNSNETGNGKLSDWLKCNYIGFTGAMTFLYNMDKETSFFVEPRVVVANFHEPYVNVDREASFTEVSTGIHVGVRICAANKTERASWPKYHFERRLFSGLQLGGLKHMHALKTVGGKKFNYSGAFYVGYHFCKAASLKGTVEFETYNRNEYSSYTVDFSGQQLPPFTALCRYRYNLLNLKLAYMLNLSNIYQRYDLNRRFNLFVEAGGLYTKCMSQDSRIMEEDKVVGDNPVSAAGQMDGGAPAVLLGVVGQYRFTDRWSLTVEPEVHYYLKKGFIGGVILSPFNDVVAKLNVGCSYTF